MVDHRGDGRGPVGSCVGQRGTRVQTIIQELERGVTILRGEGGYTGAERIVLMTTVGRRQLVALRQAVSDAELVDGIRTLAGDAGIFTETAGGATVGYQLVNAARGITLRASGSIRRGGMTWCLSPGR